MLRLAHSNYARVQTCNLQERIVQEKKTDLHDMAAEAVLHDGLEAAPGDALQQAVIPLLCISLSPQHGGDESLQGFSARQNQIFSLGNT